MASTDRHMSFDVDSTSVGKARRFVVSTLDDWNLPELADDAALLVSELVTNVVLHACTTGSVRVALTGTRHVRIEVHDGNRALPLRKDYGATASTGRGIALVAQLSSAWGAVPTGHGKVVWVELDATADDRPGQDHEPVAGTGELDTSDLDALERTLLGDMAGQASDDDANASVRHSRVESRVLISA